MIRSRVTPRSEKTYSWNHRGASGTAFASARTLVVPSVDRHMMVSVAAAARPVATSPSGCARRWTAIGATISGWGRFLSRSVTDVSRSSTPTSMRGRIASRLHAATLSRIVISSPAPP